MSQAAGTDTGIPGDGEPDVSGRERHDQGGEQGLHCGSPPSGSQNHHRPLPADPHAGARALDEDQAAAALGERIA